MDRRPIENKQIKFNADLGEYKAGQVVKVKVDSQGIPTDRFIRRRLEDAKTDGCCEVVEEKPTSKQANKKDKE